ncbi:(Fe-S)-binding protein [Chloroflexota bacterium]
MTKQSSGNLMPPGLKYIAESILTRDNILGAEKKDGAAWARGLGLPTRGETVFFAGCGYQFLGRMDALMSLIRRLDKSPLGMELPMKLAEIPRRLGVDAAALYQKVFSGNGGDTAGVLGGAVSVLQKLEIEFGYLAKDEPCCGTPLYYSGWQEAFAQKAADTYRRFKELGVKRVIGMVPSCTFALKVLYPRFVDGYDIEVKHFTEVVAENIGKLKLVSPRPVKVAYHDPCQLGRFLGIYDEPRRILGAIEGIELVEEPRISGERATCCGGGGGFETVFPELSGLLAENRVREMAVEADMIVTGCPGCLMQLKDGVKTAGITGVEVSDLAQVVARAMEVSQIGGV